MILDAFQSFDTASSLAIAVGTQASSNVLDYGISSGIPSSANGGGARDMGIGDDPALKLMVAISTTFTSGGAATLSVALQGAPDNGSGAPGTWVTWYVSPVYALAALTQGSRLLDMDLPRPPDGVAVPRYLRLLYTIAGATVTAGNINADVVLDREDQMYQGTNNGILGGYPSGIVVPN